jgi:very-short-patch-repair endonuclease
MVDDPYPDEAAALLDSHDRLPRIVTRADACRLDVSRRSLARAVESGRWRQVLPRTYFTGAVLTERDRWDAAIAFAGDGAALSGAAALRAAGAMSVSPSHRILVLVPLGNRTRSRAFVEVRETTRAYRIRQAPGPRHVEPARACADLALVQHRLDDVRALVAKVVQGGLATVAELGLELDAGPRRGSALLRQALTEVGLGAASAPEARAATALRRAGIVGFEQNVRLDLPDGVRWVADFYWPKLRAILEIDSVDYHFKRADWQGTWDRHLSLTTHGFSVIHRPPSALRDERRFIADVRAWLAGREAELHRGLPR